MHYTQGENSSKENWEEIVPNTRTTKIKKKAYTKPQITEVRLVAEEAVLANCNDGTGFGGQSACRLKGDTGCANASRS
jgi:hypothetical protein